MGRHPHIGDDGTFNGMVEAGVEIAELSQGHGLEDSPDWDRSPSITKVFEKWLFVLLAGN